MAETLVLTLVGVAAGFVLGLMTVGFREWARHSLALKRQKLSQEFQERFEAAVRAADQEAVDSKALRDHLSDLDLDEARRTRALTHLNEGRQEDSAMVRPRTSSNELAAVIMDYLGSLDDETVLTVPALRLGVREAIGEIREGTDVGRRLLEAYGGLLVEQMQSED